MADSRWLSVAAIAALTIGCGTSGHQGPDGGVYTDGSGDKGSGSGNGGGSESGSGGGGGGGSDNGSGSGDGSGAPRCAPLGAPGSVVSAMAITGGAIVATDADGNVFYTADSGIVKLDGSGQQVYAFAFGSVLAVDAGGNAFVAGSFTSTIDLGDGHVLTPNGNVDVFVVKLSPRGRILAVFQLGLCGAGVETIAVANDGRIAVSGAAMGTAVLAGSGKLLFVLPYAGQVAFDSHGDLFVGGSFAGSLDLGGGHVLTAGSETDIDGFVAEVDAGGAFVRSFQFGDAALPLIVQETVISSPRPQAVASIAIDAHDELAIFGTFSAEASIFGTTLTAPFVLPSGSALGTFVAKLDGGCNAVFIRQLDNFYDRNPAGSVAIDADGNVIVSTNSTSEAFGPFALPRLFKLAASTGAQIFEYNLDFARGYGLGVAVNACGDIYWADTEHPSILVPLQPMLRLIAR